MKQINSMVAETFEIDGQFYYRAKFFDFITGQKITRWNIKKGSQLIEIEGKHFDRLEEGYRNSRL